MWYGGAPVFVWKCLLLRLTPTDYATGHAKAKCLGRVHCSARHHLQSTMHTGRAKWIRGERKCKIALARPRGKGQSSNRWPRREKNRRSRVRSGLRPPRAAVPARVNLGRREMSLLCRQQVSVGQTMFFASHDWRTGSAKRAGKMAQPCKRRNAWPICLAPIGVSLRTTRTLQISLPPTPISLH